MKLLSRSDEILLIAILKLKDNAYGVTIIKEVKKTTGKELKLGGLWVSLDILHHRGFIKKQLADPTPQRGGRSKIYYSLTSSGREALLKVGELHDSLWQGIPEIIMGEKKN